MFNTGPVLPPQPPGIVVALLAALERLRNAVIGSIDISDRGPRIGRMTAACFWVDSIIAKIASLAARQAEGRLRPLRPGAPNAEPAERPRRARPNYRPVPLPREFGWLARELDHPDALIDAVQARLADPALQALLAAEPARYRRLLRPLCHAIGIDLAGPLADPSPTAADADNTRPNDWASPFSAWPRSGDPIFDALSPKIA